MHLLVDVKVIAVDEGNGHMGMSTQGLVEKEFEQHMKTCPECRGFVVADLRQFAQELEEAKA